jgi:site-specific DNA-cytosine methylase
MRALDLFAGAGGWDVAAGRLGIIADGVEIMREALATRAVAGLETVGHDVWNYDLNVGYDYDGLIASPPCQTFSLAGKGKGREALDKVLSLIDRGWDDIADLRKQGESLGDDRTALVLTPLHYAYEMRPEWIAWEQVPTVLPVWERCAVEIENMGYSVWTGNLQAEMYGVPQTRKRAFLLASRTREVRPPTPTHSRYYPHSPERLDEGVKKWISMAEALGWGLQERPSPTVTGGGTETGGAEPIAKLMERWVSRPDWCYRRPATTVVVGTFHPEVIAAPGYRTEVSRQNAPDSVRVTVAEAGVLQSFPADFPWQGGPKGGDGPAYLQAGNAVPPLLAEPVLSTVTG